MVDPENDGAGKKTDEPESAQMNGTAIQDAVLIMRKFISEVCFLFQ